MNFNKLILGTLVGGFLLTASASAQYRDQNGYYYPNGQNGYYQPVDRQDVFYYEPNGQRGYYDPNGKWHDYSDRGKEDHWMRTPGYRWNDSYRDSRWEDNRHRYRNRDEWEKDRREARKDWEKEQKKRRKAWEKRQKEIRKENERWQSDNTRRVKVRRRR